jgi:Na+-driven multidrug efflux pump
MTPVAFAVIFALSGAIGPIIGQNFGARDYGRVRRAWLDGLLFTAVIVVLVAAVLFLLRGPIVTLFEADGITRELIFLFCGPLALMFFFNGAIFVCNASFNNLGHPLYSTWINWGRNTLGTIPFVMLGSAMFGAPGILIGQAVGGIVFAALAAVLAWRLMRVHKVCPEPEVFAREARQLSLVHARR